jgi:hypothetical protein
MKRAIAAGGLYFLLVFLLGMALGTVRILLLEPRLGEVGSVLAELPFMLAASWFACGRLIRYLSIPAAVSIRLAMGSQPQLLASQKRQLINLMAETRQKEVEWHLLQMLPRLPLTRAERLRLFGVASEKLQSDSRIVAAEALSALFALSEGEASLRPDALAAAERALEAPVPSLRARALKLLRRPAEP